MITFILFAVLVVIPFEAANINALEHRQFDALFPNDTSLLSYVTTNDDFTQMGNVVNFTVCFWIKLAAKTEGFTVLAYGEQHLSSDQCQLVIGMRLGQTLGLCVHSYPYNLYYPEIKLNSWHHYCVLYDGTNAKATLFYNGGQVYETHGSIREKTPSFQSNGSVLLGKGAAYYTSYSAIDGVSRADLSGRLSQLQLWDRLLEHYEVIQQLHCDGDEGNIIAWSKSRWLFKIGARKVRSTICPVKGCDIPGDDEAGVSECDVSGADEVKTKVDANNVETLRRNSRDIRDIRRRVEALEGKQQPPKRQPPHYDS